MLAVWTPLLRLFSVPESTRRELDALGVTSVGVATRGIRNVSAHPTLAGGAAGATPIVVTTRNPYDLSAFPDFGTYLTIHDDTPTSLAVAAELLVGDVEPVGELPVTVPNDGNADESH